jgi:hypothetical protein
LGGNRPASRLSKKREHLMARDLLLWLLGVPISVLVLLHLFGVLHW